MNEKSYVTFAIEEKCNSKCGFCSLAAAEGPLLDLHVVSMPYFKKFLSVIPKGKFSGIIFSGGEVTLNKLLPQYASYAREQGFRHIMIQTNARALSDLRLVKQLKASGINEYFVSFHSAQKDLSDKLAGKVGSYLQTVKGLENLHQLDLTVVTNTVMNAVNYTSLPEIAKFLLKFSNIIEMQFWAFVPMNAKARELMLPYESAAPYLNQTIKDLRRHRKGICVKYFPVCLLKDAYKTYHNNDQPDNIGVDTNFGTRFKSSNFKRYPCCEGTDCEGFPELYNCLVAPESR